jgi:hypothetical protein
LTPFALALARPVLRFRRLSGWLTPPFWPPPKSRCQFSQGRLAPLKYQLWPSQGMREPAPSGPVVVRPWEGDFAEMDGSDGFAGAVDCAAGCVGFAWAPAGAVGFADSVGFAGSVGFGGAVGGATGFATSARFGASVGLLSAGRVGGSRGVVDPMSQAESNEATAAPPAPSTAIRMNCRRLRSRPATSMPWA